MQVREKERANIRPENDNNQSRHVNRTSRDHVQHAAYILPVQHRSYSHPHVRTLARMCVHATIDVAPAHCANAVDASLFY